MLWTEAEYSGIFVFPVKTADYFGFFFLSKDKQLIYKTGGTFKHTHVHTCSALNITLF